MTISVGVAWQAASDHRDPADLVDHAKQALYRAKHAGRNCMQLATLADAPEPRAGQPA